MHKYTVWTDTEAGEKDLDSVFVLKAKRASGEAGFEREVLDALARNDEAEQMLEPGELHYDVSKTFAKPTWGAMLATSGNFEFVVHWKYLADR